MVSAALSGSDTLSTVHGATFKYCPTTGVGLCHKASWENAHNKTDKLRKKETP